jgi:hypothetical protein
MPRDVPPPNNWPRNSSDKALAAEACFRLLANEVDPSHVAAALMAGAHNADEPDDSLNGPLADLVIG